jgi:hypothetical protein
MKNFNVPIKATNKNVVLVNYWNGYIDGYVVATKVVRAKTYRAAVASLYKGARLPTLDECLVADCR